MIHNIGFYTLLPTASTLCCVFLLNKLIFRNTSRYYVLLFANLALMNLAQTLGYLLIPYSVAWAEYAADAYLITAYFFFTHLILLAISLSGKAPSSAYLRFQYWPAVCLSILHMNGLIVESYRIDQNTLMHNDGKLSWLFDGFILMSCLATLSYLFKNLSQNNQDQILMSKNMIAILSLIPLISVFFILILLSTTPYAVPVAIVGPLICIYAALTFYYLSRDSVANLSIGIVFFFERLKMAYLLLETGNTKRGLKQFNKSVEAQFIKEALVKNGGNIQATADYLDINHTTLRNKIKEYKLQPGKSDLGSLAKSI